MPEQTKYEGIKDFHQYAWDYFQYHSRQRLTTFNFYIIICSIVATGYMTALKETRTAPLGFIFGLLISFLSFIFWKLDLRNKQMIKNVEEALKHLESETPFQDSSESPHVLKIFLYEEAKTNIAEKRRSFWPWNTPYSYSRCFNLVFFVFGALGMLAAIYVVIKL